MQEVKTNLDQALYIDTEKRSVVSGMLNTIQEIKVDRSKADYHSDKGGEE